MNVRQKSNFKTKFSTLFLNTAGIALPSQRHAKYINLYKYYLLVAFFSVTSSQIVLARNVTTVREISLTLVLINSGIFLNGATFNLHLKKKYLISIVKMIKEDFAEIHSSSDTISSSTKFKKFFWSFGISGIVMYILSLTGTVLLFPFSNKRYSDADALLVPSAFPWNVDTLQKYLLTIALQISWLGPLSLAVIFSFFFTIYYTFEIKTQYHILCKSLKKLNLSNERLTLEDTIDNHTEDKLLQCFNHCIKHHQKIRKFSKNFNDCYNTTFSMNLFYSVPTIALVLLSVVEEKNFSSITRNLMLLGTALTYLILFTTAGQILQNANERFRFALYDLQWYSSKSIKFRKTLVIVLSCSQRILRLEASNRYVASVELLFDILKLSYSYYNIMNEAFGH